MKTSPESRRRLYPRWFVAVSAIAALAVMTSAAGAQVYYLYPGAPVVKSDQPVIGSTIGIGDDLFRILGYARFNISDVTDLGLELVLDHVDRGVGLDSNDGWRFGVGADFKYSVVPRNTSLPFDLSVNAGLGFESGLDYTNIDVPIGGVVSRPIELNNGRVIAPYGGLYVVISHVSFDIDPLPAYRHVDNDDTEVDVELRAGTKLQINDTSFVFATLHVGNETMLFLGLDVRL